MAGRLRTSDLRPSMFNAGVKSDGNVQLLRMAMKHDADLPERSMGGIKYEVLYVKCRDVKLRPILYILKGRRAQGTKNLQNIVKDEMDTIARGSFERPKRPVYKTWETNNPKPLRDSKGGARARVRDWRERRRQWMIGQKREYEEKAKAYREHIARGIMSVDFNIRMTRDSDGKELGASFTVFRSGSMRCSGGMFDDKSAKMQLDALHDFMKIAYTVPRKTLKLNRLTATFIANFNVDDLTTIRNRGGMRGDFYRLFRAKYKKQVTAVNRIQSVGESGRLSVPLSEDVSLLITTSGRCQLSIKDGASIDGAFNAAKEFLRRNLPANSYHNDPINRASRAVRGSKIARSSGSRRVPGVTRGGTTCPKDRVKVNGACPRSHPHERLNPQGFPCCYKRPGTTRSAIDTQKNVNLRKGNNTDVFVQVYMDPRMTRQDMVDIGDVVRFVNGESTGVIQESTGLPLYKIESRSVFRSRGFTSEILLREGRPSVTPLELDDKLKKEVRWLPDEYVVTDGYYVRDIYINGRQGTRYPKAELVDILRRMGGVGVRPAVTKDEVLFEIRKAVFKTKMDVTNYAGVRSADVTRQVRSSNRGGRSTGNTALNRVPMYIDTRGRLVVGKRVASTFPKADLDRFARSLSIDGKGVPRQSLVNRMRAKVKTLTR